MTTLTWHLGGMSCSREDGTFLAEEQSPPPTSSSTVQERMAPKAALGSPTRSPAGKGSQLHVTRHRLPAPPTPIIQARAPQPTTGLQAPSLGRLGYMRLGPWCSGKVFRPYIFYSAVF